MTLGQSGRPCRRGYHLQYRLVFITRFALSKPVRKARNPVILNLRLQRNSSPRVRKVNGMRLVCGIVYFDSAPLRLSQLDHMCAAMVSPGLTPHRRIWQKLSGAIAVVDFVHPLPALEPRPSGSILALDARLDEIPTAQATPEAHCAALLDRHGIGSLNSLLGDFAIVDWHPGKRELLLARDSAGIRPLFFHHVPGKLVAFASFPRALHQASLPARHLDAPAFIREALGVSSPGETIFEGVHSVEPGEAIVFTRAGSRSIFYAGSSSPAKPFGSPQQGADALREALLAAVQSRVTGSGPVATHLSGGLDSSAIAVIAARTLQPQQRRLLGYSMLSPIPGMPQPGSDHQHIQNLLNHQSGIETFSFGPGDPLDRRIMQDRPLSAALGDPENAICAHAAAQGASLVLSGWGGDEAASFGGRGSLAHALLHGNFLYLLSEVNSLRRLRGFSTTDILRGEILSYLRAGLQGRALHQPSFASVFEPNLLRTALASATLPAPLVGNVQRNLQNLITGRHIQRRTLDWAEIGAAHGIAFTFPMLDRRVIQCALNMQPTWFLRDGFKRRPFRDAMHGILPESICWRHDKQTPFPDIHLRMAFRRTALRAEIEALCHQPGIADVLNVPHIHKLLATFPTPTESMRGDADVSSILPLMLMLSSARFLQQDLKPAKVQNHNYNLGELNDRTAFHTPQRTLDDRMGRSGNGHDEQPQRFLHQPV